MKPHTTDVVSLVFGTIFLGIAALWLITRFVSFSWSLLGWSAAAGLVVLGTAGIIHAVNGGRRGRPE